MGKARGTWLSDAERHLPAVADLMRRVISDHGGAALGAIAGEHLATGGKRLRALLALAAGAAQGVAVEALVGWAAACELLHNATLVHDDLQDGDLLRRGAPTIWARHGMAQAINAGDLLFLAPFLAVAEIPVAPAAKAALSQLVARRGATIIRGQAEELVMASACDTRRERYVEVVAGKTSGLFELPVEGAAVLAGRDASAAAALAAAFRALGVVFQIQDDVLDLFGDKGRDAPGGDVREGKVSALVVEHLGLHPEDRDWLRAILHKRRDDTSAADVEEVSRRFATGGALAAVCERIVRDAAAVAAVEALCRAPQLGEVAAELVDRMLEPIRSILARAGAR
ncbi:MAG: polyprenyl synthetase family protein [Deltaproteobacteria bacterium]|nr:polyprenyl synthetase family protein [Deltaproteobacteria bacterium]